MKKILLTCVVLLLSFSASAELSIDDFELKKVTDLKGWTPRYAFVLDDNLIGHYHYAGVSFFKRDGAEFNGPTLRAGLGQRGEKINLAYTSGFTFMAVDMGLSYVVPDKNDRQNVADNIEGIGLELGLRFWVVQLVAIHMEKGSYVSLGYGF